MHYFLNLLDKVLYIFRKVSLSIIRGISTLYTCNRYLCYANYVGCLLAWSGWSFILTTLADSQHNWHDKYLLRVYSVEIPLMMDSGRVRNM